MSTGHITMNSAQSKGFQESIKRERRIEKKAQEIEKVLNTTKEEEYGKTAALTSKVLVRPDSRQILYEGVSKEGEGRYAYLKHQAQKNPRQRFAYPITSSQVIGWDVQDDVSSPTNGASRRADDFHYEYVKSPHGRKPTVRTTFYRTNLSGSGL
eukprot:GEZU01005836.1.p1 GENE.GEZU01005836.1~~GEZU01005836.1.p1  ORF type:complete len:154 (+),score=5.02 GEZU01005836.1:219-680(+)